MIRVLVAGSRSWIDLDAIKTALGHVHSTYMNQKIVLVSGNCPQGADRMCEDVARSLGWEVELHPADWNTHGKRAGFVRNKEMVDLGANICLAFIRDNSRGASMTYDLAEQAGTFFTWKIVPKSCGYVSCELDTEHTVCKTSLASETKETLINKIQRTLVECDKADAKPTEDGARVVNTVLIRAALES